MVANLATALSYSVFESWMLIAMSASSTSMGSVTPSAAICFGLRFKISILLHGEIARGVFSCDHSLGVLLSIAPPPSVSDRKLFVRIHCGGSNRDRGPNACGPPMTESETDEGATDDSLSLDEVRAALHALTSVEHKKLDMIARSFSGGTGLDPGEIVTDAVESSLTARSCPRDLPIMVFLVQTMRSRINNHRKKCKKSVVQIVRSRRRRRRQPSPRCRRCFSERRNRVDRARGT